MIGCPAHLRFYTCIVDDAKNISVPHTFGRERRDKEPPRLESGLSFLFSQSRLEPCAMTRAAHVVAASVVVSFPISLAALSLSRLRAQRILAEREMLVVVVGATGAL